MSVVPQKTLHWLHSVLSNVNTPHDKSNKASTNVYRNTGMSTARILMLPKHFPPIQISRFGQMSTV